MESSLTHSIQEQWSQTLRRLEPRQWRASFWLLALVPGFAVASFETLQIALFEQTRAPNVTFGVQALLTFVVFYAPSALIPRTIWAVNNAFARRGCTTTTQFILAHIAVVTALSTLHLFAVTVGLATMHAAPGWPAHLPRFFGEIWLRDFALWASIYALTTLVLAMVQRGVAETFQAIVRLEVRRGGKAYFLDSADIFWVEAAGNYVQLHTRAGLFTLRETLSTVQSRLPTSDFSRTHRSALVGTAHVRAIRPIGAGAYRVELDGGIEAPLSRRNLANLKDALAGMAGGRTTP